MHGIIATSSIYGGGPPPLSGHPSARTRSCSSCASGQPQAVAGMGTTTPTLSSKGDHWLRTHCAKNVLTKLLAHNARLTGFHGGVLALWFDAFDIATSLCSHWRSSPSLPGCARM
eukprot:352361-Chlamydomonas_euryale.AAC.3